MNEFQDIATSRLRLRLISPAAVAACLAGDLHRAGEILGASVPAVLLEDTRVLTFGQARLAEDPAYAPWGARAIIAPDQRQMVGHIRFHSTPDPEYLRPFVRDTVELGYQIFPAYRRQGYALEAVNAAMAWAHATYDVRRFAASVSPTNLASLALLSRLGFAKIAEQIDEIDGVEHLFLRDMATDAPSSRPDRQY